MIKKAYLLFSSKSIKINYTLNLIRVVSGAAVGIITMPYINKALGAEALGKVEYINTLITYFILFSALGIPMYGIREISKVRENSRDLAKTCFELLAILSITTILSYLILFGIIYQLSGLENYRDIILVMSCMIFLTNMGAEWYFQGIENQLFLTIRHVLVRIVSLIIILWYIEDPTDYLFYAICLIIISCGANMFNMAIIFRKILKENIAFSELNLKKHIKPVMTIFIATISVNIYLQLDNFLIGSISGDKYLGYYSVANKLVRFVIGFITIIGAVMLPRLSFLYQSDKEKYTQYLYRSFTYLMLFSLPFTVYFLVFAKPIIYIFAGNGFEESVLTMRIISPLCFIVSIAYFFGFLILYPQNKEKVYTRAVIISAVFSVLCNYYAVNKWQQNGAAVVAVLSELLAIIIMFLTFRKQKISINFVDTDFLKIIIVSFVMLFFSLTGVYFLETSTLNFLILTVSVWLVYGFGLYVSRETEFILMIKRIKNYLK